MDTDGYLEAIARESAALADAAERAGLDAPVPSCPGWTLVDLIEHIGNVQRWAARTVVARATERIAWSDVFETPPRADLVPWFRAASAHLVATLRTTDPSAAVWTFDGSGTAAFWFRRQAQEVAVHRVDADLAAGRAEPIATELAADGLAEWLGLALVRNGAALTGAGETVHLHCTDTADGDAGEWLITFGPDGPAVEPVHAKGDVAARAPASALDLFVWGRVDADALEVFGDASLLERLRSAGRV